MGCIVNIKNDIQTAIIIMSAMSVMGLALFLAAFFSEKSTVRNHRKIINTLKEKAVNINFVRPHSDEILTWNKSGGSIPIGIIMSFIGLILIFTMANMLFFKDGFSFQLKIELLPFVIGIGLLYIGLSEFSKNIISIYSDRVVIEKGNIFSRNRFEVGINEFLGIGEYVTETVRQNRIKRYIFHEHFLYHENPDISGIVFAKLPDNNEYRGKINKISEILNMPIVMFDSGKVKLDYPECFKSADENLETEAEDTLIRSYASTRDLRSRYIKILNDNNDFSLERSYRLAMIWGLVVFAIAVTASVLSGSAIILLPVGMMAAIITGVGLKCDLLYINEGHIVLELYFAGIIYSRRKIKLSSIESIITGNDIRRNMADSLQIMSESDEIIFGQALKKEELEWIKDKILEYVHKN